MKMVFRKMLKEQVPLTLKLAAPVVISEIGQMIMGVIDTLMIGPLGPEYIGGIGVGAAIFSTLAFFGIGLTLGLDYLASYSFGRKELDQCNYWLIQSLYLAIIVSV